MPDKPSDQERNRSTRSLLMIFLVVIGLLGSGYFIARYVDWVEEKNVEQSELDDIVVTLREKRNRLEVYKIAGNVTTVEEVTGGWGDFLKGKLKIRQPWSVAYFGDMSDLSLNDYIWDERTRTLIVRAPTIRPDPPNIDESRQVVAYGGPLITRDMQTRLRSAIARTSLKQANTEATKPENVAAANLAAREKLAENLKGPLQAAGIKDFRIEVLPREGGRNDERWDVSRSIAEVLAERASK